MEIKSIFVKNLKKFRKIEGISQLKLARECNTDASYIGQIEMGRRFPSIKLLEKIAKALSIEPYRFFMEDSGQQYGKLDETEDFLLKLPPNIRKELIKRFTIAINTCVKGVFNPK